MVDKIGDNAFPAMLTVVMDGIDGENPQFRKRPLRLARTSAQRLEAKGLLAVLTHLGGMVARTQDPDAEALLGVLSTRIWQRVAGRDEAPERRELLEWLAQASPAVHEHARREARATLASIRAI
ncbi:hypothetical protein [Nocardiopsis alba]|uniref:hypothetical protein n=1 Tax=Nocardiopsis alba TaxID=53437 RepID=UPI003D71FCE8